MTIYTRRGDAGTTSLGDGTRVIKSDARVEAYGSLDELGSAIGFASAATTEPLLQELLAFVQHRLFACSASLATPGATLGVTADDTAVLERAIDHFEAHTGPLKAFVLAGGSEDAVRLHLARAIARRAERRVVALSDTAEVDAMLLAFVNRVSDALFAAARYANLAAGVPEVEWDQSFPPPSI